jgi:glucokinase
VTFLVGDIGGTHSRFGLVAEGEIAPDRVAILDNDSFSAFDDAVAAYLEQANERPRRAVIAVAGPTFGRRMTLTNRAWTIDASALEARFGFARVDLLNDFVAQAYALPHLEGSELAPIGGATPAGDRAKAAVGPGTGLGVAGLLRTNDGWLAAPSECGHVEFAAVDEREFAAFQQIRRTMGRVSAEYVLSGPGLARLHAALRAIDGVSADVDAGAIAKLARAGDGPARETVTLYLRMLARFAGDVALTFSAAGGVYLCGGVTPRLLDLLDPAAFRAAFEAKSPHEDLMAATATVVVTSDRAGLIGCAAAAAGA